MGEADLAARTPCLLQGCAMSPVFRHHAPNHSNEMVADMDGVELSPKIDREADKVLAQIAPGGLDDCCGESGRTL